MPEIRGESIKEAVRMSELIEDKRCGKCRWHSEDHLFCENPNSDFYGWFRNDWKRCDKYEEQEAQE